MKMAKYPLLIITGPTAVGKTELSLKIAEKVRGEIISADSMQIYRFMDIGTAKASAEDRARIKHHMIDIINPDEKYSVAQYQKEVDRLIREISAKGSLPILVGGTGLYIRAVVQGFLFPEMEVNYQLRAELNEIARKHGSAYLHQKLAEIDPDQARKIHPNDLRRIIRGIEIYKETGHNMTYYLEKQKNAPPRYNTLKIGLIRDREELYSRINARVDQMIEEGLVEEINNIIKDGYKMSATALQGLGYKEIIGYLKNEYSLEEAKEILKRNTRHYAKKQITWFKAEKDIHWFNLTGLNTGEAYQEILCLIANWKKDI
ncbi:MAG TPA: tRNA (adenosine(37)-N6)-dimethylallyltransferase MiaA [Halanaerobiaceae bacterium]|jgi:tRNA dimethylallyltransferase|nr:tRNA (adenosine(37)-N6)-dimethylallyltransferase MiaA [Halanaerobiaceae bacterium]HOA41035.1 tRNA (adenosine(37)-N6)-dimethylallyltransferase MiaA [Halanaerobiales bacterium]